MYCVEHISVLFVFKILQHINNHRIFMTYVRMSVTTNIASCPAEVGT